MIASLVLGFSATNATAAEVDQPDKDCLKTTETVQVEESIIYDKNGNPAGIERKETKTITMELVDCPK